MYSRILKNTVLPIGDLIFGGNYLKTLEQWNAFDKLSEEELLSIQRKELEKILKYSISKVPFYKDIQYDQTISPAENLKNFPILTKDVLRNPENQLVSSEFDKNNLKKNFSSGSSGIQSFSYSDKKNVFYLQGISYHWYMWGGLEFGDGLLQFGISPNRTLPKKLKDVFFNVNYQEAFALDDAKCEIIYNQVKKSKTKFIIGYPSAINQFAEFLIKNKLSHPIKTIVSLGDKLFSHFEENFKIAFEKPLVIDTYGCAEGFLMACRYDTPYYYISAPHVYIEIVDDQGIEVEDGELGHVLVTCFTNLAQPFIRYKLGDLAIKLPREEYPLNRKFQYPLLQRIIGRETDIVKTPSGKTLIVHSFTGIIEYFPDIKQYQVIQENENQIIIKYIVDDLIPLKEETLEQIRKELDKLTDGTLEIIFEKTDFIPNAPSGKPQIIKSLI